MTKYQILLALYTYLEDEFRRYSDRSEGYLAFLSGVNPHLWTDGKTADPAYYEEFMKIADEIFEGDECSVEEGWYYASRYLFELSWSGSDIDEVLAVFSACTEEQWEEIVSRLTANTTRKFKCPCCGYYTLDEPDGSYEICEVCNWENDPVQLKDPDFAGGANRVSLNQARSNFQRFGAVTEDAVPYVREPAPEEVSGIVGSDED